MQTFTPDGSTYHDTAELPVDLTDYRNAASVRVGIEAALDNAAWAAAFGTRVRDVAYDTIDGIASQFNCDSATSTDWQDATGVTLTVPAANNDRILYSFAFDTDPNSCTGGEVRLVYAEGAGPDTEVPGSRKRVVGGDLFPRTLSGVHQVSVQGDCVFKLQCKCSAGDWSVYAGVTMSAVVVSQKGIWP